MISSAKPIRRKLVFLRLCPRLRMELEQRKKGLVARLKLHVPIYQVQRHFGHEQGGRSRRRNTSLRFTRTPR